MCIRDRGNTNGWGFGAMYELTYDVYINEDRSSILQPLVNASVVTTRLDGYTDVYKRQLYYFVRNNFLGHCKRPIPASGFPEIEGTICCLLYTSRCV